MHEAATEPAHPGGDSAEDRLRRLPAGTVPDTGPDTGPEAVTAGQVFRWAVAGTLGILCVVVGAYAVYNIRGILVLVVIAAFLAVSLDPAVRWLVRQGLRRGAATGLILLVAFGVLGGLLAAGIPPLVREGNQLFSDLPGFVERLPEQSPAYRRLAERYQFTEKLSEYAADLPEQLVGNAAGFVRQFLGALAKVLTVLVLTIYFMADMPRLRRGLVRLFPRSRRPHVAEVVNVLVEKVGAYMIGNLLISVIAGVASFVVLAALGVPYALPLAVAVAITDMIPLIGATLGAVLCTAITFFTSDIWPATVLVIVFFVVYQQLENYLIVPRVMRNTVDISSLAVLLAALVGANVAGVIGALMAIPLAAAVKVVLTPLIQSQTGDAPPAQSVPPEAAAPVERSEAGA